MDRRTFVLTAGATVGIVGTAGCGAQPDGDDTPTDTPAPTATPAGSPEGDGTVVDMVTEGESYYFDPIGLRVEAGETVTWRLENDVHSATAYAEGNGLAEVTRIPDGAEAWDSGTLQEAGATFDHTPEVEGTYDYFCTPHKSLEMVGRLVVGEPGGPAEGSMPPDGAVPESATIVEQGSVAYADFAG